MSPPLVIATIVAVIGTIFPAKGDKDGSSSSGQLAKRIQVGGDAMFFSGMVVGVGLSWLVSTEMRRARVGERVRLWVHTWFESENNGTVLKDPTNVLDVPSTSMGEQGTQRTLVSPKSSLSSSLHTSVLTLSTGTQMAPRKAQGVELYHVLQGVGTLCKAGNKQDDEQTLTVAKGQVVMVEPWCSRWMSNRGLQELVFMRISDGGLNYMTQDYDMVGVDESQQSNVVRLFKSGANYVSSAIRDSWAKENSGEGTDGASN